MLYRLLILGLMIFVVIPFLFWLFLKIKNSKWLERMIGEVRVEPDYSKPSTKTVMKDVNAGQKDLRNRVKDNQKVAEDANKASDSIQEFLGEKTQEESSKEGGDTTTEP